VATFSAAVRGSEPLQRGVGPRSITATVSNETTVVTLGDGAAVALATDPSFAPHDLAGNAGDWLVAGNRRGLDGRERLALVAGRGARQTELRVPGGQTGAVRAMPVILEGERLLSGEAGGGIAWLEGSHPRRFAVWAAPWEGEEFGAPELVAPAGPGTQTALSGVALADGSWLLVWAGFDGEDDEILWSRRTGDGWSEPRRVAADDATPDITPSLAATGGGAALVWSSFEGGSYRLSLATFREGAWSEPATLESASGLYPEFVRGVATPTLTYLEASPQRRWVVAEIDPAERRELTRAAVASSADERPLVVDLDRAGVRLRFADPAGARSARGASLFRAWEPPAR
jgi:hypothetical protein